MCARKLIEDTICMHNIAIQCCHAAMLGLKAAVLQAACRGCRGCRFLAHALALLMLAFISFFSRSLAYVMQHEHQWRHEDLAYARDGMDMQLADQRQRIADQRQHYRGKVRAGRHQAARQQQLHAAERSGLQQQLADQQQQLQEHVDDTWQQLADQQHIHDQELADVCQQLVDKCAERLALELARQRQQHTNALHGLRQHLQQLLASLQAERQQLAAIQQDYSQAMEALAVERQSREAEQAQSTAQVQQLEDQLGLSQNMVTQRQALLEMFCFGPTGYHQLQADWAAAVQTTADLRERNDVLTQSNALLTEQAQAMQHPVYRVHVSSSFMTCMLPSLLT